MKPNNLRQQKLMSDIKDHSSRTPNTPMLYLWFVRVYERNDPRLRFQLYAFTWVGK